MKRLQPTQSSPSDRRAAFALAILIVVTPYAAATAQRDAPDRSWMRDPGKMPPARARTPGKTAGDTVIADLPYARGRTFKTLDDYLDHLRVYAAPTDRPWYREVSPGVYRLETGNLRADTPPRTFSRADLEQRFGFRK